MSLLAYLVPRIASNGAEPAATQALAYLLNASPDLAQAFINVVARTGVPVFPPGRIAAEEQHGDSAPDLTIRDTDGVIRVLVENKFWAGLTEAQPVAYLDALPRDAAPSVLVFVAPHQRIYGLWHALKEKCRRNAVELASESSVDAMTWARTDSRILAITSWKHVLEAMERAAVAGGHSELQQDIAQLRGLTDEMNAAEFLPLREDEVTDIDVPWRLINYSGLIEDIVGRLVTDGVADTKGVRPAHGYTTAGRYLNMHAKFQLWLGVHLDAWCASGITPIWWRQNANSGYSGIKGRLRQAAELFDEAEDADGHLWIPIRLKTGVERDSVIEDAAQQMRGVADKLLDAFPSR